MPALQVRDAFRKSAIEPRTPVSGHDETSFGKRRFVKRRRVRTMPPGLVLSSKSIPAKDRLDALRKPTRSVFPRLAFPDDSDDDDDASKPLPSGDGGEFEQAETPTPVASRSSTTSLSTTTGTSTRRQTATQTNNNSVSQAAPVKSAQTTTYCSSVFGPTSTIALSMQTAVDSSSQISSQSKINGSARNAIIAGATIGAVAFLLAAILVLFLCMRKPHLISCLNPGRLLPRKRKRIQVVPNTFTKNHEPTMSTTSNPNPLVPPPILIAQDWDPARTFAEPETPRTRARRFAGPLGLNPITPLTSKFAVPFPSSPNLRGAFRSSTLAAKSFFRFSNTSSHSTPSPMVASKKKDPSVHTRSSVVLPMSGRYDRLPSLVGGDGRGAFKSGLDEKAMHYFSEAQSQDISPVTGSGTDTPRNETRRSQVQSQRDSIASADSEPAHFRSVPSWVRQQEELNNKRNQKQGGLPPQPKTLSPSKGPGPLNPKWEKPIPPIPSKTSRRKPVDSSQPDDRSSVTTDKVFKHHPGDEVEVPGLKGKRLKSGVLDRNIWGWGINGS